MNRIMFTGTHSGCGKTTVTCAVLSALTGRGVKPVAFKCGPDYIDPMFHRAVSDIGAYNLDPYFLDGNGLRAHLASHAGDFAVIEGAMGYYDGIATTDEASAYTVARETRTPVVLVVNAKGAARSLGAVISGFARYRSDGNIRGVIFNGAAESRYADLRLIAENCGVRAYGFMPNDERFAFPSRHLGLYTAAEIPELQRILAEMGTQVERSLDIGGLLGLAATAPALESSTPRKTVADKTVRLAVARDAAFCFMYQENLDLLRELGCEPVFFSPVNDGKLPDNIHGLYLCGGYPELYTQTLSDNRAMRESVRRAIESGLPAIAECGGFMYLHDTLDGVPMCGVIRGNAYKTPRLQRFGYAEYTAERGNMLCRAGESIRAREFHYWDSESPGDAFTARKAGRGSTYRCVHATDTLYAGFPHLYLPANPAFAENFVDRMCRYGH